jgi:hypothetical protein
MNYRKQWEEPEYKETRRAKLAKWFGKKWPSMVGIACLVGVPSIIYFGCSAQKSRQQKLCAPDYYTYTKSVAHDLEQVTCMRKNGTTYHKYVEVTSWNVRK